MHPVLFKTPYFTVYTYGVFVSLAMMLALFLSARRRPPVGASSQDPLDLLLVLFVSGVIGARVFFVLQHWEDYRGNIVSVLWLQKGGLVWYGGFLGAVACGAAVCHRRRLSILRWADFFAPILALAHAVGRVGCFFNGCCHGLHYPVQLFESALLVALSLFLFFKSRSSAVVGEIFGFYLIGYAAIRFGLEFLRADQTAYFSLTIPQWISLAIAFFSFFYFKALRKRS